MRKCFAVEEFHHKVVVRRCNCLCKCLVNAGYYSVLGYGNLSRLAVLIFKRLALKEVYIAVNLAVLHKGDNNGADCRAVLLFKSVKRFIKICVFRVALCNCDKL